MPWSMKHHVALALIVAFLALTQRPYQILACSISISDPTFTPQEQATADRRALSDQFLFADIVFRGRAISVTNIPDGAWTQATRQRVSFSVDTVWKGSPPGEVSLMTESLQVTGPACQQTFFFAVNEDYLVYARQADSAFQPADGTRKIAGASDALRSLGPGKVATLLDRASLSATPTVLNQRPSLPSQATAVIARQQMSPLRAQGPNPGVVLLFSSGLLASVLAGFLFIRRRT
jgi:hypothetical protein